MTGVRTEDSQISASRVTVEDLLRDLPGTRDGDLAFDKPWEIRAFAIAVAAHKAGQYDWPQFQGALIDAIRAWEDQADGLTDPSWSYYVHWVTALEAVLAEVGSLDRDQVSARTGEVLATPPNRNHHEAHLDPVAVDPAVMPG
jgi:nitrile hydratase